MLTNPPHGCEFGHPWSSRCSAHTAGRSFRCGDRAFVAGMLRPVCTTPVRSLLLGSWRGIGAMPADGRRLSRWTVAPAGQSSHANWLHRLTPSGVDDVSTWPDRGAQAAIARTASATTPATIRRLTALAVARSRLLLFDVVMVR